MKRNKENLALLESILGILAVEENIVEEHQDKPGVELLTDLEAQAWGEKNFAGYEILHRARLRLLDYYDECMDGYDEY